MLPGCRRGQRAPLEVTLRQSKRAIAEGVQECPGGYSAARVGPLLRVYKNALEGTLPQSMCAIAALSAETTSPLVAMFVAGKCRRPIACDRQLCSVHG
jgi:hypothetical protein